MKIRAAAPVRESGIFRFSPVFWGTISWGRLAGLNRPDARDPWGPFCARIRAREVARGSYRRAGTTTKMRGGKAFRGAPGGGVFFARQRPPRETTANGSTLLQNVAADGRVPTDALAHSRPGCADCRDHDLALFRWLRGMIEEPFSQQKLQEFERGRARRWCRVSPRARPARVPGRSQTRANGPWRWRSAARAPGARSSACVRAVELNATAVRYISTPSTGSIFGGRSVSPSC